MNNLALRFGQTFALLVACISTSAQVAAPLEVSDPHWGRSGTVSVMPHGFPVDRGQAANYPGASEVSALFRNVGQKAIKSVTWKYFFFKDKEQTQVLASYTFSSSKRIEPGAAVRLKESVSEFAARDRTDYQSVRISRIKYEDGSVGAMLILSNQH